MTRVFLAGATGVVGSGVLAKLIGDCNVSEITVLVHNNAVKINSHKINTLNSSLQTELLNLTGYDVVYNCVGEKNNRDDMYALNVEFASALLKRSVECGVKTYVYFSSVGSYGARRRCGRVSELTPSSPMNYYESTKLIAEVRLAAESDGIRLLILQPSNILVTSNPGGILLPVLCRFLMTGIVPIVRSRNGWLNYVSDEYVANVAIALASNQQYAGKFIINTPIRYLSAISILISTLNINPKNLIIYEWLSNFLYVFCLIIHKLFHVKACDVVARKIYEIDNDVCFQSQHQVLLDRFGKYDVVKLYQRISFLYLTNISDSKK